LKHESKFWQEVKAKLSPHLILNRIETASLSGFPDVIAYTKQHSFITIELKVSQSNSVKLSPHQIGFHILRPINTYILVKHLAAPVSKLKPCDLKLSDVKLYKGSSVQDLATRGVKLEPFLTGWNVIIQYLASR
jgi:Holliday junction resolvase